MLRLKRQVLAVSVAFTAFSTSVTAGSIAPKVLINREFGDRSRDHNMTAIAASPTGKSIVVGGVVSDRGGTGEGGRFVIWWLNRTGERLHERVIEPPIEVTRVSPSFPHVQALAFQDDETVIGVIAFEPGKLWLVRVTPSGATNVRPVEPFQNAFIVSRMLLQENGGFLLLGTSSGDAAAVELNAQGMVVWSRTFNRGLIDTIHDGAVLSDGTVAVFGSSGVYKPTFTGRFWFGSLQNRTLVFTHEFPGSTGGAVLLDRDDALVSYSSWDGKKSVAKLRMIHRGDPSERTLFEDTTFAKPACAESTRNLLVAAAVRQNALQVFAAPAVEGLSSFEPIALGTAVPHWICRSSVSSSNAIYLLTAIRRLGNDGLPTTTVGIVAIE